MNVPSYALNAVSRLRAGGYAAFLVGGCVRDSLMGRVPGDYDAATSARPEQTEAVFAGERIIETGLKHGTVTLLLDGHPVEITTFRTDGAYSDHRHPDEVRFAAQIEDDLARRDFTVNAMAWSPETGLVDPCGGQDDLARKRIRCVGDPDRRFDEDALRILRALRFASVLGFDLDPATAASALAKKDLLEAVSRERIAVELVKLVCGPDVRRVVCGFWPILAVPVPELAPMAGFDQRSKYHCYDVLTHCAVAAETVRPDPILRLAALLHDCGKPACFTMDRDGTGHFYGHGQISADLTKTILTRLRFDNDTIRRVTDLVALHDYPLDPEPGKPPRAIKRLLGKLGTEDFFRLLALKRADSLAHDPGYRARAALCDRVEALTRELLAEQACFRVKDLAVNGRDLIALGIDEGPAVGRTLNALLEAVLGEEVPNERDALLALARSVTSP